LRNLLEQPRVSFEYVLEGMTRTPRWPGYARMTS
jgi:hypothetical protein